MLAHDRFWQEETDAPLLGRNGGYLRQEDWRNLVGEQVTTWPSLVGAKLPSAGGPDLFAGAANDEEGEEQLLSQLSEANRRIVERDAERTFLGEAQRRRLRRLLAALIKRFNGEYGQGLGYAAGFLLLTLDEAAAGATLVEVGERYLPGYWRPEAVAFATDALVFRELLRRAEPTVADHLEAHFVLPETYCQKWFVGLAVHVLPFELLFPFFESFLVQGRPFLFQFGLSVVRHLREELLRARNAIDIYALLRLDPARRSVITPSLLRSIIDGAAEFAATVEAADLPALRQHAYDTVLRPRLEAAQRAFEAAKEKSDDEDEEDEGGEECQQCHEMSPEVFCKDCRLLLCGACHETGKDGHSPKHQVTEEWSKEGQQEEDEEDEDEDEEADDLAAKVSKLAIKN